MSKVIFCRVGCTPEDVMLSGRVQVVLSHSIRILEPWAVVCGRWGGRGLPTAKKVRLCLLAIDNADSHIGLGPCRAHGNRECRVRDVRERAVGLTVSCRSRFSEPPLLILCMFSPLSLHDKPPCPPLQYRSIPLCSTPVRAGRQSSGSISIDASNRRFCPAPNVHTPVASIFAGCRSTHVWQTFWWRMGSARCDQRGTLLNGLEMSSLPLRIFCMSPPTSIFITSSLTRQRLWGSTGSKTDGTNRADHTTRQSEHLADIA